MSGGLGNSYRCMSMSSTWNIYLHNFCNRLLVVEWWSRTSVGRLRYPNIFKVQQVWINQWLHSHFSEWMTERDNCSNAKWLRYCRAYDWRLIRHQHIEMKSVNELVSECHPYATWCLAKLLGPCQEKAIFFEIIKTSPSFISKYKRQKGVISARLIQLYLTYHPLLLG